jgi:hypothetical protein
MTPAEVFLLWHVLELDAGDEDVRLVGVYSTQEAAEAVWARGERRPGFQAAVEGFLVHRVALDQDPWHDGPVADPPDGADPPGPRAKPVLADLIARITAEIGHAETSWGRPAGREAPPWDGEPG